MAPRAPTVQDPDPGCLRRPSPRSADRTGSDLACRFMPNDPAFQMARECKAVDRPQQARAEVAGTEALKPVLTGRPSRGRIVLI